MVVKHLAGNRIVGTAAERAASFPAGSQGGSALFGGGHNAQSTAVPVLGADEFTISCWIYPTNIVHDSGYNHWISTYDSASGDNWAILTKDGEVWWYTSPSVGSGDYVDSNVTLTINTWHHVAVKRNSSDALTFVIDGVVADPSATKTNNYDSGGATTSIGGFVGASGQNFYGNISDVAFWNTEVSNANLQAIYNNKTLAGGVDTSGLTAYYPLSVDFTDSEASADLTNNNGTITTTSWQDEVVPDLVTGSIFEESDTGKHYMLDVANKAWNEVT